MYPISNALKAQLTKHTRAEHVRGTIGGVAFDDHNVISMSYSNRCSNTDDLTLGLAYIGQLTAEFCGVNIPRKSWKNGKKIIVEWGVDIQDGDEVITEWLPLGVFYISSAEWTDTGVSVTANDAVSKLDKPFGGVQTNSNTIGGFAAFACQQCALDFALTTEQARALPNGTRSLKLAEKNDIKTWRDFVAWLATTAAGYVTATRDGKITIRTFYNSPIVDSWGVGVRIAGASFSDFDVEFAGVEFLIAEMNADLYYTGEGAPMVDKYINIGADPFIQQSPEAVQRLADVVSTFNYTPFNTSLLSNLVYDLGDCVECENGVAGDYPLKCCLMSIDWTFKQLTKFQGFGADPDLSKGKSATDKALNGANSQNEGNKIEFVKYINSTAYTIGASETEIVDVEFALKETADVEEWTEIKLKATNPADLIIKYYLDSELIAEYSPADDWDEGGGMVATVENTTVIISSIGGGSALSDHTTNYHYHLNDVTNNGRHHWRVTATAPTGSVNIAVGDIHAVLWAQGMAGEDDFTGLIKAADVVPFLMFDALELFGTLSDDVTVTTQGGTADNITTESGDVITTETGAAITTANIEDLPDADPLDGSEYIPIVQNGATVKTTTQDAAEV